MADDSAGGDERDERRRWRFIWVMTAFAIVTYGVTLFRPDVPAPSWVAPAMMAVVGIALAEPAARRVLDGYRRSGGHDAEPKP